MPGDPERATIAERKANGIPIDAATWDELLVAAEAVGVGRDAVMAMADGAAGAE